MWFVPIVEWGDGVSLILIGTLYQPNGGVRDYLNLLAGKNSSTIFTPRCEDSGIPQFYQGAVSKDQLNDIVNGNQVTGNLAWGWWGNDRQPGPYLKCRRK